MWLRTVISVTFFAYLTANPVVQTYDTIIVGLGASGCAAASVLCKAGKKVLALEAQNRIGGRVHTVRSGSGVVELGAEWIHGIVHSPTYELAVANNITIMEQTGPSFVYRSDGSMYNSEIIEELVDFAMTKAAEPPQEPEPLGEYLTKEIMKYIRTNHSELIDDKDLLSEFLYFMDPMIGTLEASSNWNEVTTHDTFEDLEGSLDMSWHKYGYKTLFEILLNTYNNGSGFPNLEIKLNKVVNKISYPNDPTQDVEVNSEDGFIYRARNVIVTVSLGVLKERYNTLFSPPLPENKVELFDYISMGSVGKIILEFDEIWWTAPSFNEFLWREADRKKVPDEDLWTTKVLGPSTVMGCNTSLALWTTGNESRLVETLGYDVVLKKSMELIRKFMGRNRTIPEPIGMLRTSWYTNPYTRGTYSFDNLKTPLRPQLRSILAEPIKDSSGSPRVLFAGEATNRVHYATVHGAVETGYREANRLLAKTVAIDKKKIKVKQ